MCQLKSFNIPNDFLRLKRKTCLVSVLGNANTMTRQDFDWNSLKNEVIHAITVFRVERFRVQRSGLEIRLISFCQNIPFSHYFLIPWGIRRPRPPMG